MNTRTFQSFLFALCIPVLVTVTAYAQPPDTLWTRLFGGSSADYGYNVQQTIDEGFIVCGSTQSFGAGQKDVYLIKTDSEGQSMWEVTFGGSGNDEAQCVQQTADGGYIMVGRTSSFGAGSYDVYVLKTDSAGNLQWSNTFGGSTSDEGRCVRQTLDGGYIITGWVSSFGAGEDDILLLKIDSLGNPEWDQTFGGSDDDWGYCIQQTSDGGYFITGRTWSFGAGSGDVYLIKTDPAGINQWDQTFGGTGFDGGYFGQQIEGGGYIAVGFTFSFGAGLADVYLIKTDASGNEIWSQTIGGSNYDYGYGVHQTPDGGYIVGGHTASYGAGLADFYIVKTDSSGSELWSQTYGGTNYDWAYSIQRTIDEGFVITGHTLSYGAGGGDVWLIRLTAEVTPPVSITLTPINPPIQIPASGGSFAFDALIQATSNDTVIFDVWTQVILPNGIVVGPLILRTDLTIAPGSTISREITQFVPGTAPAGDYTYQGYVGTYPFVVLDSDELSFEKLEGEAGIDSVLGWIVEGWDNQDRISSIPAKLATVSAYPSPFNATTTLIFTVPEDTHVNLSVYDITGRRVVSVMDGWQEAGMHEIIFDGSNLASGIYLAHLKAGDFSLTQKLVLMK